MCLGLSVCVFVCLSVSSFSSKHCGLISKKVLGQIGLGTRNSQLDLYLGIFLPVCNSTVHYYLLSVSVIMLMTSVVWCGIVVTHY